MISAVCIMAVPEGQTRRISDFPVFLCTASFSVFAYLWMLIVYRFWTPNVVTLLEALLTLLFLVLLVASAYLISVRVWAKWGQQQTLLSNPVAGSGDVAGKLEAMASVPAPAAEPPKTHGCARPRVCAAVTISAGGFECSYTRQPSADRGMGMLMLTHDAGIG